MKNAIFQHMQAALRLSSALLAANFACGQALA
jgi:hypothetical protein